MRRVALVVALAACAPEPPAGWFVDVGAESGFAFVHDAGVTEDKHLPETMGGGGLLADLDGDDDLDILCLQSGPLPHRPGERPANALFLNDGGGRFTDATADGGDVADGGYAMGVTAGDVDGDGDLDLYITALGPDRLLLNDGAARFTDATEAAGLGDPRWTAGATFFDADGDGDLDLYVTAYLDYDLAHPKWCGRTEPGWRSYCHPDAYDGTPSRFWRNRGDGTFEDASAAVGLAPPPDRPGKGLGALPCDFDGDGATDLYQANDSVENVMMFNAGDGTFWDGTLLSGTGVDERGMTEAGMGLASGDVDGDGDFDLFVTNFDDESNTLYRNDGDGLFTDATIASGLEAASRMQVGFGTALDDFDNDGDLDLAVANGHIIDNVHLYHDGKTHAQISQLFTNDGAGVFAEATADAGDLSAEAHVGRGLYSGDIDGDGDLDLLLTNCNGRALLLANTRGGRSVLLRGLPRGTRVEGRRSDGLLLVREAFPQPSYFGQGSGDVHLGLGDAELSELRLERPGHEPIDLPGLDAGIHVYENVEGRPAFRPPASTPRGPRR